ncbi:hypothetical protein LZZ85_00950 [Terrimonas sp. NA20]|uniref:DUF3857 domain-containing protein n=1 Tax=Terrimonas ginsenosidimutans TaxID=2908004 RepID=A0ABS9KKG5_9BACT|nr:hypothetical protein [Terrimonas ginsenosidimutans]MCG2612819.1 hypothetical protein [Terrimonas ginsenosidimutans]
MHKITLILLATILFAIPSFAQSSASNTKKLLTANEWELKYYLENGRKTELREGLAGLRLVFIPSKDLVYEYTPGQEETIHIRKGKIMEQSFKYQDRIEEPDMLIKMDLLEKEGKLAFIDEFSSDSKYFVYEKAGSLQNKGYPSTKYEVEKLEVPMQRIHPELLKMIDALNTELKKNIGNLYFHDKNKTRYLMKELKLEASDYGLRYSYVYETRDKKNLSVSHDFMPENIKAITDMKLDPESSLGLLKLDMNNENSFYRDPAGKPSANSVLKLIHLHYLKESSSSFDDIKTQLEDISDAFVFARANRLEFITEVVETGRKIRLSLDGKTSNFELTAIDIAANKLYIHYNLDMVGLSETKKGSYLSIIPLKDITGLTIEKSKTNPNTLLMHGKRGFETFAFKTDMYLPGDRIYTLPLFNLIGKGADPQRIGQILAQLIDDDGGEKVKLVINP